jgi:preprotein translocase subunit YajC
MSAYSAQLAVTLHGLLANTSKTSTKTPTSSSAPLLILLGIFVIAYFFFFRNRNQQRRKQMMDAKQVEVGDEVMLTSGIIGRITAISGDRANVEIAPDIEIEVVRAAIGRKLTPTESEEFFEEEVPEDPAHAGGDTGYHASDDLDWPGTGDESSSGEGDDPGHDVSQQAGFNEFESAEESHAFNEFGDSAGAGSEQGSGAEEKS